MPEFDLSSVWGDVLSPSSSSSQKEEKKKDEKTTGQSLEDIWGTVVEEKPEEEIAPSAPTLSQKVGAIGANFIEGIAYDRDIFSIDDKVEIHPWVSYLSTLGGEITRMIGEGLTASAAVSGLMGIPWITAVLASGGSTAKRLKAKLPIQLSTMATVGSRLAAISLREAAEGLVISAIDQVLAPQWRKPGTKGTVMNVSQNAWGGVGYVTSRAVLTKFLPRANPSLQRIIGYIGDNVFGVLGSAPLYEDKHDMIDDLVAAETIAIGVVDLITYNIAKGRIQDNPAVREQLDEVKKAHADYVANKTVANQRDVYTAVERLWETINPEKSVDFADNLVKQYEADVTADFNKVMNPATKELAKRVVAEGGVTVTPEESARLAEATPAKGDALNTKRMNTSDEAKKLAMEVAEITHDSTIQTHEQTKAQALEIQKDIQTLKEKSGSLAKALQEAPATKHALRERIVALSNSLIKEAEEIHSQGIDLASNPQFMENFFLLEELTANLQGIDRGSARTLNIGNAEVTGASVGRFLDVVDDGAVPVESTTQVKPAKLDNDTILKVLKAFPDEVSNDSFLTKLNNVVLEFRGTNLLRNITTWANNMLGQTLNVANEAASNYAATIANNVGRIYSRIRGIDYDEGITLREANARILGELDGMYRGVFEPIVSMQELTKLEAYATGKKPPTRMSLVWDRLLHPEKFESLLEATSLTSRTEVEGVAKHYISSEYLFPNAKDTPIINIALGFLDWTGSQLRLSGYGSIELSDRPFASGGYFDGLYGEIQRLQSVGEITPEQAKQLRGQVPAWRKYKQILGYLETLEKAHGTKLDDKIMAEQVHEATGNLLRKLTTDDIKLLEHLDSVAMSQSDRMTYKEPLNNSFLRWLEDTRNKFPATKWLVPFFHTPAKLMERWWETSPASRQLWNDILGRTLDANGQVDRRRQTKAIGQLTVSLGLYATGVALWKQGKLTPTARNADERRAMQEAGVPENSVKIGDVWIPIGRLDPTSTYLTAVANVCRALEEADDEKSLDDAMLLFGKFLMSVMQDVTSNTWATNVRNALDIITSGDENKLIGLGKSVLSSLNPLQPMYNNLTRFSFGGLNPFHKTYLEDVDWSSLSTTPRLDTFGKPILNYKNFAGIAYSEPTSSPIRQELVNLGISLPKVSRYLDGVKLTDEQYYRMMRYLDTELHAEETLNAVVTGETYTKPETPVSKKEEMIKNTWNLLTKAAQAYIAKDPEYIEALKEAQEKAKKKKLKLGYKFNWFKGRGE